MEAIAPTAYEEESAVCRCSARRTNCGARQRLRPAAPDWLHRLGPPCTAVVAVQDAARPASRRVTENEGGKEK
jgi:hypothetical protein